MITLRCPNCQQAIEVSEDCIHTGLCCTSCGADVPTHAVPTQQAEPEGTDSGIDDTPPVAPQRLFASQRQSDSSLRPQSPFGDYELLEEIARGGMGVVYRARHRPLNRIVALKMIRSGELAAEADVQRFHSEAEAAATLNHPNIVPIYDVGEQDGHHFFTMALVSGSSLKDKLSDGPLPPREAAELTAVVAEAVQAAHEKGIVHRDLKPSNVLIDESGRPQVADFGLAKQAETDSSLTATGQILGTPAFMPPEQAAGSTDKVGPRSDIYSLGAVLYCLLTGRPPFQSANVVETLKQVLEREPVSPRQLNPAVDRDLETICLRCLQKDPQRRYATAADFSADLKRYLGGRPILARPLGRFAKTWRWCRRNKLATAVILLLAVLGIGGPVVAVEQFRLQREAQRNLSKYKRERDRADVEAEKVSDLLADVRLERNRVQKQRDRALKELSDHRQTMLVFEQTIKNSQLLKERRFLPLKRKLLKHVLGLYQRFVDRHRNDLNLQYDVALSLVRIGDINRITPGLQGNAATAYEDAIRILNKLREKNIHITGDTYLLANAYNNLGLVYKDTGKTDDALTAYRRSLAALQDADRTQSDNAKFRLELRLKRKPPTKEQMQLLAAACRMNIAVIYRQTGREREALEEYQTGIDILKRLIDEHPGSATFQYYLQSGYQNRGNVHVAARRWEPALRDYDSAITVIKPLADKHPDIVSYQDELAAVHNKRGVVYLETGKFKQAEEEFEKALAIRDRLARDNPTVTHYRSELAANYTNLANLKAILKAPHEALRLYDVALKIIRELAEDSPDVVQFQERLGSTYNNIAHLHQETGNPTEALAVYQQAVKVFTKLEKTNRERTQYAVKLAEILQRVANLQSKNGETADSMKLRMRSLSVLQGVVKRFPKVTRFRAKLGDAYHQLGMRHEQAKEWKPALAAYNKALAIRKRLVADEPEHVEYQSDLASTCNNLGNVLKELSRHDEAEKRYQQGLEIRQKLAEEHPENDTFGNLLGSAYKNLGLFYQQTRRLEAALREFEKGLAVGDHLSSKHPKNISYRRNLGDMHHLVGWVSFQMGNPAKALPAHTKALQIRKQLADANPDHSDDMLAYARTCGNLGILAYSSSPEKAVTYYEKGIAAIRSVLKREPNHRKAKAELDGMLVYHALALAKAGQHLKAAKLPERLMKQPADGSRLYNLACIYGLCEKADTSNPGNSKLSEQYADKCIKLLERAKAAGFFKPPQMRQLFRTDDSFSSLYDHDDFREFADSIGVQLPRSAGTSQPAK